ncbi:MAG: TIGR01458 family HAD-type hydrolase [Porticoccaceae bacterium]|nr:TIGR01458 family HAD-type hydrolase [Pseudomonadales bacterium]
MSGLRETKAVLFDLDGVFYEGATLIAGGARVLNQLAEKGVPHCFITNTTTRSRRELAKKLLALGLPANESQIITAPVATASYLRSQGYRRCRLVVNESVREDFTGIPLSSTEPDCLVIGDIGPVWDYALLNDLFQQVMGGADIVAMHKNRFWKTEAGLQLDIGGFVTALEYVTGVAATVVGKPSTAFFELALQLLGQAKEGAVVVGDDIENDIGAAQQAGIAGVLVKTGKYRSDIAARSAVKPAAVIDSVAGLPALFW